MLRCFCVQCKPTHLGNSHCSWLYTCLYVDTESGLVSDASFVSHELCTATNSSFTDCCMSCWYVWLRFRFVSTNVRFSSTSAVCLSFVRNLSLLQTSLFILFYFKFIRYPINTFSEIVDKKYSFFHLETVCRWMWLFHLEAVRRHFRAGRLLLRYWQA
jgi:hypothetical protein